MMLYVISSLSSNQSLGSGNLLITLQLGKLVTTLFAVIFLFYTNRTGLPHTRQAGSVLSVRFIMRRLQQATANPKTFRRIRTAPRRSRRLCRPDKCCGFAEDFRENAAFCGRTEASAPTECNKKCGGAGRCGERTERCRWQRKRSERVAAVKILSVRRKAAQKFWAPQQDHRPLRMRYKECGARPSGRGRTPPLRRVYR